MGEKSSLFSWQCSVAQSMFGSKLWSLPFLSQKSCVGMMFHFRPESLELRSLGLSQVAPFQTSTKFHQITPLQTPLQSTNYQHDNNWLGTNLMYLKQFWETKKYSYRQTLPLSLKCRTTTRSPRTRRSTRWPRPPCTPPPPPWRAPGEGEWKRLSRRVATSQRLNPNDNTCWNTYMTKYNFIQIYIFSWEGRSSLGTSDILSSRLGFSPTGSLRWKQKRLK